MAAHRRPKASTEYDRRDTVSEPISRVTVQDLAVDDDHEPRRRFQPEPWHWVIAAAVIALGIILGSLLWKRDVVLEVAGHRWERSVEVERFVAVSDDQWCTSMPGDAYSVSRRSEVHHTDRVPDGEDCRTIPESCSESCSLRDNGNGSGSTVCTKSCSPARQECTTRYRSVDVYADRCYFTVDRWRHTRVATVDGTNLTPLWPTPRYKECGTVALGCERLGERAQTFEVRFLERSEGEEHVCEFPQSKWRTFEVGQAVAAEIRVMTGSLDCDSVTSAEAP